MSVGRKACFSIPILATDAQVKEEQEEHEEHEEQAEQEEQDSPNSSSGSEPSTPPTPPADDHVDLLEDYSLKSSNALPSGPYVETQDYCGHSYVHLNEDYDRRLCWSNDPDHLYLATYFRQEPPNLANDFKVNGLCPVVKEDDSDKFILRDAKGRYYIWDAWDGYLRRVTDIWTQGFDSQEQVIENLLIYLSWVEEEADVIYRNREED
ncbi:uncharacterized protein K460DRAFT_370905 [Cucurbitaria berberidis CBS 394.84]|uniref:Uncharacterized protein n=1 Tax=Cucurbitaria berberidis CBS 394.84 TaxID=1168544 RepID=A0A9P4G8B5_9PLEO|nr:uncharacterized protein K460DRAFT_370905 [Cucurbitaria berberidis CBS 394.84]KAF1840928.1 hypothetical protein K460DRAFT_370905 [Cucurbitaria berberidis CBS 394.84]